MFCAISGEIPKDPVVCITTGVLFEKSLVTKYLNGGSSSCPVTNIPMRIDDLLEVKVSSGTAAKPRLPISDSSSIPGLLKTFQNEWDELMLETFTLKQHLDATRKELSHALFQHEAACRVVGRLTKERDEAINMMHTMQAAGISAQAAPVVAPTLAAPAPPVPSKAAAAAAASSSEKEPVALSAAILSEINAKCKELSAGRKGRKPHEQTTSKEAMTTLAQTNSFTPHKADNKSGGVTCVAVSGDIVLSGSNDKNAILTDLTSGKVICKLTGHTKKVTSVAFVGNGNVKRTVTTASADKTVRIWSENENNVGKYSESFKFDAFDGEVSSTAVHPTDKFMISTCSNASWSFLDLAKGVVLKKVTVDENFEYTSCAFHPDGLILGTGTNAGVLKIWDIRAQDNVANCAEHSKAIRSISFSENGYLAASGGDDGMVKIWDLRKLQCTKTLDMGSSPVSSVSFDASAVFLAIGGGGDGAGNDVEVKVVKDWSTSVKLAKQNTKAITGCAWSEYAKSLVTCSLDRTIKVYKPSA